LHVTVLKVQHHGSKNNINEEFCKRITADNYIFFYNGRHNNPDLDVIKLIFDCRMAGDKNPFTFWFSSRSQNIQDKEDAKHMVKVEKLVKTLQSKSNKRLTVKSMKDDSMRVL